MSKRPTADNRLGIQNNLTNIMPYLTTPAAKTERTYRYFVELASKKLNYEGVPEKIQIVDVVVEQPTKEAIASLIAEAEWLENYAIVACWTPEDCTEF